MGVIQKLTMIITSDAAGAGKVGANERGRDCGLRLGVLGLVSFLRHPLVNETEQGRGDKVASETRVPDTENSRSTVWGKTKTKNE